MVSFTELRGYAAVSTIDSQTPSSVVDGREGGSAQLRSILAVRYPPAPDGTAPTDEELAVLLQAAASVPDHGGLRPWRFVVVRDEARHRFGAALATDCLTARPDAAPAMVDKARRKAFAAPVIVVIIASPHLESNVPVWEQVASAACCGYAIVLAAQGLGLGAVWKSTAQRDGDDLRSLFAIADHEQLLGWINVGGNDQPKQAGLRPPADIWALSSVLPAGGA
jgi:nitroreductase